MDVRVLWIIPLAWKTGEMDSCDLDIFCYAVFESAFSGARMAMNPRYPFLARVANPYINVV